MNKKTIGGWKAQDFGFEPGKDIEYRVEEIITERGSSFRTVTFFKAYLSKRPEDAHAPWKKGFSWGLNERTVRDLVARINHLIENYLPEMREQVVFQPRQMVSPSPTAQAPTAYYNQQPAQPVQAPMYPQTNTRGVD